MVAVNALANILPINNVTTGEASDSYGNLFAPAGITFAIWGAIYILLALFTLYQLGLFQRDKGKVKTGLLKKIGVIFSVSSIANTAWIFAWHYDNIPLSMILMAVILLCLIVITQQIKRETLSPSEKVFIRLPFSVYFGWITVATVANATVLLVSLGWNGFGIPEPVWAIAVLVVAMLIGLLTMVVNKDIPYGLVLVWAFTGILIKHITQTGFAGQYPAIIATIITNIVLILIVMIYVIRYKMRKKRQQT